MRQVYLDYNATTPIAPSVREAMAPFFAEHFGNPSSGHWLGRACKEAIEDARSHVARLIGADSDEIVFTGGGTESNNLAIKGSLLLNGPPFSGHLVISVFEHPAVLEPARYLQRLGIDVTFVKCSQNGIVAPEAVERALRAETRLVSIMHANNEIGTIQPIREIAEICRVREVLLHTDAAQTIGKIRTHVDELDVDLLTMAGHKFYAPKGVGALYVRRGVALEPITHGAGHESGLRPGTENTPYIVGLGRAARLANKAPEETSDRMAQLRDRLAQRLRHDIPEELWICGEHSPRLPNTLNIVFPRVSAAEMLARVPDLCASTGSACHSTAITMSPTLAALGMAPEQAHGAMRLSVGWYTSEDEIDRAAGWLVEAWESQAR
jgi:cysteine desulfurase